MSKWITLTRGLFAVVDDADYESLSKHTWTAHNSNGRFYALTTIDKKCIYMHRMIMGFPALEVDHRNRLSLDNRRENLRECTRVQNLCNMRCKPGKSGFIGVSAGGRGRWRAYLSYGNRHHSVGYFGSKEEAARARDVAAIKLRGEFAILNFPDAADKFDLVPQANRKQEARP